MHTAHSRVGLLSRCVQHLALLFLRCLFFLFLIPQRESLSQSLFFEGILGISSVRKCCQNEAHLHASKIETCKTETWENQQKS
ncbi:hypothetical protein GGR57DRAFT_459709 [Xylariaceae sp. FL1272]|nr:hypothetical protein GGR57DRAFT_459709 [Xylariaceae sp. FL1272]